MNLQTWRAFYVQPENQKYHDIRNFLYCTPSFITLWLLVIHTCDPVFTTTSHCVWDYINQSANTSWCTMKVCDQQLRLLYSYNPMILCTVFGVGFVCSGIGNSATRDILVRYSLRHPCSFGSYDIDL